MLKQRNLYVRPGDNAEAGKREMDKLENFGWTKVRSTPMADGSVLVSYVRDTDEDTEAVENERRYRAAVLAKAYAEAAIARITALKKNKRKSAGLAAPIIYGFFAVVFVGLAVAAGIVDGIYKMIFGSSIIKLAGEWAFYNYRQISMITGVIYIQILFIMALGAIAALFIGLCFASIRKRQERNLDTQDYADFSVKEYQYYREVIEQAGADMDRLYPAGATAVEQLQ